MVGRIVRFDAREWVICTVDHLNRLGDLRGVVPDLGGGWKHAAEYSIRNVPIDELAGLAGCSCRLHGWQALPHPSSIAPAAPPPATVSVLAWVSCLEGMPPDDTKCFWWHAAQANPLWRQRFGTYYERGPGQFYDGRSDDFAPAVEVSHWAPWPSNKPELTVDDGAEESCEQYIESRRRGKAAA